MEKIIIAYSPEGKPTAIKIQESIKKAGFPSKLGAISTNEDDEQPEVAIAVISADSADNAELMATLDGCAAKNINVVPFVTTTLPKNIFSNCFLDEHVWIDGASQPLNTALGDLSDLLKRNYKEIAKPATKRKSDFGKRPAAAASSANEKTTSSEPSKNEKLYKTLFYLSIAVIAVMLFILIGGGMKQENREALTQQANYQNALGNSNIKIELSSELKKSESALVGHWKMSDYSDNQFRATHEDSVALQTTIDDFISRVQLVFKADKTFTRIGFSADIESGTWEYDPQSKYLKLKPTNVNQYDIVQIQEVTPTQLILVVSEKVNNDAIITKLTFTKIN